MNAVTFPMRVDPVSLNGDAREKAFGLRELRAFLRVASTGNLGRAAREMNVSQPAISLQLRKLEAGFGTPLLTRHGRGVTLTPAGACLRDRLHTVMHLLASPLDDSLGGTPPTRLSLAIPSESGLPLIAPLARMFRLRWPDLALDVKEGNGADLEEWILHRRVDLAILQDPPSLPALEAAPLLSEPLGLVLPASAALAQGSRPLSLRDIACDALILPGQPHWIRRRLDQAAQRHGVRLNPVLQVASIALSKAMVRGGVGYAVLPRAAVQDEIDRGALAFRLIGQPPMCCTRVLAFHRAASNSLVPAFAEMVRQSVTALARDGAWAGAQVIKPASTDTALPREGAAPPARGTAVNRGGGDPVAIRMLSP
jgi:LysR family nitrogen assimilation transcriptional regulator